MSRIAAAAHLTLVPPTHIPLEPEELLHFDNIIAEQAKAFWTQHQLELAALLARTMHQLNYHQQKLRIEGGVIKNGKGNPVVSPRQKLINDAYDRVIALRRSLSIHARAQGVNRQDMARRNDMAKDIDDMTQAADDDLIAKPTMQ
jgi:hypothetical protein